MISRVPALNRTSGRVEPTGVRVRKFDSSMIFWGQANLFLVLVVQFLNWLTNPIGLQRLVYASMILWIVTAVWRKITIIRLPMFVGVVLAMGAWLNICSILAEVQIARFTIFTAMDIMLYVYVLSFLQASALVWISPESRRVVGRFVVGLCVVSAIVSLLQFLGFGPAIQYAAIVRDAEIVYGSTGMEARESIRAPGLHANLGSSIVYAFMAMMMIMGALRYRFLKWFELASIAVLLLSTILVQVRTLLPLIAVGFIYLWYEFVKKYRSQGIFIGMAVLAVSAVFFVVKIDSFAYFTDWGATTMTYRTEVLWTQAYNILDKRPFTGIGIEPAFAGWTTQALPNNWVNERVIDNGYLLAGCWGGYPAMFMLMLALMTGGFGSIRLLQSMDEDGWHFAFKRATAVMVVSLPVLFYWGSQWANPLLISTYFVLVGLAMPSEKGNMLDDVSDYAKLRAATKLYCDR